MKKILLIVAGVILVTPFFVSAQTAQLTDQFAGDQTTCVDLQYNMGYRSRDAKTNGEVSDLQDFLISQGYLSGDPTGYFGTATLAAVKKFQSAVGLGSAGVPGYGGVGPKTRANIKNMTCGGANTQVSTPTIHVATPTVFTPAKTTTIAPLPVITTVNASAFSFSRTSFDFKFVQGDGVPAQQLLTFTNRINEVVPFTINVPNQPTWLSTGYVTSQLLAYPGSPIGLGAGINPASLAPGYYTTTIIISGNFEGAPIKIPVNLTVASGQVITTIATSTQVTVQNTNTTAVPTVEVVGSPTLTLQYDSAKKESALVGKGVVKITAGSSPINLGYSQQNAHVARMLLPFNNGTGLVYSNSLIFSALGSPACVFTATAGCLIQANSSMVFSIENTAKTSELFAGTYLIKPDQFIYYDVNNNKLAIQPQDIKGTSTSNSVTIVGETSPYISSASSFTNASGYGITTITGVRFDPTSNTVDIGGRQFIFQSVNNGTVIQFIPSAYGITPGSYLVQVTSPTTGASNKVGVNILGSSTVTTTTTVATAPSVTFTASPTSISSGQSSLLSWSSANATSCTSSGDGVSWGWPSARYTSGAQYTPSLTATQTYTMSCTGAGGTVSQSVTVTVASTPPTIAVNVTPTLTLEYNSAQKESALVATYYATITAGSQALSFPSYYVNCGGGTPLTLNITNSSGQVAPVTACTTGAASIPAGQAATYVIKLTANPNQIFAGSYTATLWPKLSSLDASGNWMTTLLPTPILAGTLNTNTITVIGERAPYITSATVDASGTVGIVAWRLGSENNVSFGGNTHTRFATQSGSLWVMNFSPSDFGITTSGVYPLQISTNEGASNIVYVNVPAPASSTAICTTLPCHFDGKAITNTWGTVDAPPTYVSAPYPYNFTLPMSSSLQMTLRAQVWAANPAGPANTMIVKVDGVQMYATSSVGMSGETHIIAIPTLVTGAHTIEIYATPDTTHFMFDYFDLVSTLAVVAPISQSSQLASVVEAFSQEPVSATAPAWAYSWTRNLEVNSPYAEDVTALQTALAKEGVYTGEVTGGFYSQTYLAVKAFQAKYGIEATGFVGPITLAKLNELY